MNHPLDIQTAVNIIKSLPTELARSYFDRIFLSLFTKSELIRFLLLNHDKHINDPFGALLKTIKLENLTVIICDDGFVKFDDDRYSNDILSISQLVFDDQTTNLESLLQSRKVHIKKLIIRSNMFALKFLLKYCDQIELQDFSALCLLINPIFNPDKIEKIELTIHKKNWHEFLNLKDVWKKSDIFNYLSGVKTRINMHYIVTDSDDFKKIFKSIKKCQYSPNLCSSKLKVNYGLIIYLEVNEEKRLNNLVKHFNYALKCLNFFNKNPISTKIILRITLGEKKSIIDYNSILDCKIVEKLILDTATTKEIHKDLSFLKMFENIKTLNIKGNIKIDKNSIDTLGSFVSLRHIIIKNNLIDYKWLSQNLPKSLDILQLYYSRNKQDFQFEIPENLKTLIIDTLDPTISIDFNNFKFNPLINLKRILIFNSETKTFPIFLNNLTQIPKYLKEIRFHQSDNLFPFLEGYFFSMNTNVNLRGVYSNIDVKFYEEKELFDKTVVKNERCLEYFSKFWYCSFNVELKKLNLGLQRIKNIPRNGDRKFKEINKFI